MIYKTIIEPNKIETNYWKDIWRYRELFYIFSWRDIKVRYKQTVLGIVWALLRPLLTMLVFTFIFNRVAQLQSPGNTPYTILVFAGLLPWQFFASALTESSNSLIGNTNLITKVYFPRLIIPASAVITCFIDYLISLFLLVVVCVWYQYLPPIQVLLLPVFSILAFLAAFGPGLYLTALNVKYRDFRYIIPFLIQFGFFISPVGYSSSKIPQEWIGLYSLNPMVGVIDAFRWCIVKDAPNPFFHYPFYISLGIIVFFIWLSFFQFRKMEKHFADLI